MKLNVNLEEELEVKRQESAPSEETVKEVTLLLEQNAQSEREALRETGLDSHLRAVEDVYGLDLERKRFEDEYGPISGKVFTIQEIESLCRDYALKFVTAQNYHGDVDKEVGVKLRKMKEEHNISLDKDSFFLMAPAELFNLKTKELDLKNTKAFMESMRAAFAADPVLFYKMPKQDNMYLMVHKWGNDFSISRLIRGLMTRNYLARFVSRGLIAAAIIMSAFAAFGSYTPITDLVLGLVLGSFISFISLMIGASTDSVKDTIDHYNEWWHSEYK